MTEIFEYSNHIMIYTGYSEPVPHKHAAAHILLSWRQMHISIENKEYFAKGIMIPSGTVHTADNQGKSMIVFIFDETTSAAEQINEVKELPEQLVEDLLQKFSAFKSKDNDSILYCEFVNKLYENLCIGKEFREIRDERIDAALYYINKKIGTKITCREVAEAVFMSESRFSHLFKNQMGITFIGYLQMRQLSYTYYLIINGKSITDAAIAAGFSSSSHFAATNKRVFGLTASDISSGVKFYKIET